MVARAFSLGGPESQIHGGVRMETDVTTTDTSWLDDLPTSASMLDELIDYPPTTYPGEETTIVSTRIPISWAGQFEEFRDKIGSRMPKKIWARNSDLVRWCIGFGFKHLRKLQEQLDSGEIDATPLLEVQYILEQVGGRLTAQAAVRQDAFTKAAKVAEAITHMVQNGEEPEAAAMVIQWMDAARSLRSKSPYWENVLTAAILRAPGAAATISVLCSKGYIVDEELQSLVLSIPEDPVVSEDPGTLEA